MGLSLQNSNASFLLGVVLYEQNKLEEAINAFKHTVSIEPTNAMAFYYMSLSYTKLGNFEEALQCGKIAVQLLPFKLDFMVNLAECYYDVKNLKEAIRTYRAVELISPEAFPLLISAGIFWQKVKKYRKSLKYLERAVQKPQADYLTKYYLAVTYAGLNRLNEAKNIFIEILEQSPDFYDATIKLAIICKANENYDKAIELLENLFIKTKQFSRFYPLLIVISLMVI